MRINDSSIRNKSGNFEHVHLSALVFIVFYRGVMSHFTDDSYKSYQKSHGALLFMSPSRVPLSLLLCKKLENLVVFILDDATDKSDTSLKA